MTDQPTASPKPGRDLVATARRTVADGLVVGTSGNVSRPRRGHSSWSPRAASPTTGSGPATPSRVDLDGRQVLGTLRPTSELPMHLAVYRTPTRRRRRPHPRRARHRRLHAGPRTPADPLHDRGARRPRPGRPLRPVRQRRTRREHARRAPRPHRLPAAEPRHRRLRREPRPGATTAPPSWSGCAGSGSPRAAVPGRTPSLLSRRPSSDAAAAQAARLRPAGLTAAPGPVGASPGVRPGAAAPVPAPPRRSPARCAAWPPPAPLRTLGGMRLRTAAAAAATTVLGAGAAAVAAGRYASDAALTVARPAAARRPAAHRARRRPTERITLTRTLASLRPGTYGLDRPRLPRRRRRRSADGVPHPADCRRTPPGAGHARHPRRRAPGCGSPRRCTSATRATPSASTTPTSTSPANSAPLPAWFLPGERDTWVITVHGLGTTREHPMVVMPFLHRAAAARSSTSPTAATPARPRPPDGISHLGDTEWRDLDAAIRYAVRYGAQNVVLLRLVHRRHHGAARRRPLRAARTGSAASSWTPRCSTGRPPSARCRRPARPARPAAAGRTRRGGRTGLPVDRPADAADPGRLHVPTLILHGPDDIIAPWDGLPRTRRPPRRPGHPPPVPHAPHAAMWNADPPSYEEALRRFLTPLM